MKKILWISPLIMDFHLHKTTQIEILRGLQKQGHEVYLFASYSYKNNKSELTDLNSLVFPIRYISGFSTFLYILILYLIMPLFVIYWKPDIIIIEPGPLTFCIFSILSFPIHKKPYIFLDIRSGPVGDKEFPFFDASLNIAKKYFSGITTITPLSRKKLSIKYNINQKSIGVWSSGVSNELFNPNKHNKARIRKKMGLEDKFIIFYHGTFGSLSTSRGIVETIEAISLLKNKYSNIILYLLGSSHNLDLESIVRKLGVQNHVIIHDPVPYPDVPYYIAFCDVGIVPLPDYEYWRHQCPLNLLEYLAMEKVSIVTDMPANRNVIGSCECGIYALSEDPGEIATAITYAIENKEMLKTWGEYGRKLVEEKYSWEMVVKNFEKYIIKKSARY